jgi:hypothetical protein
LTLHVPTILPSSAIFLLNASGILWKRGIRQRCDTLVQ